MSRGNQGSLHHRVLEGGTHLWGHPDLGVPSPGGVQPWRHTQLWGCGGAGAIPGVVPSRARSSSSARAMAVDGADDGHSGWAVAVLAGLSPRPLKALQAGCGCWDCASTRGQVCHTHGDTAGPAARALLLYRWPHAPVSQKPRPDWGPHSRAPCPQQRSLLMSPCLHRGPNPCVPYWGPIFPLGFTLESPCPHTPLVSLHFSLSPISPHPLNPPPRPSHYITIPLLTAMSLFVSPRSHTPAFPPCPSISPSNPPDRKSVV